MSRARVEEGLRLAYVGDKAQNSERVHDCEDIKSFPIQFYYSPSILNIKPLDW